MKKLIVVSFPAVTTAISLSKRRMLDRVVQLVMDECVVQNLGKGLNKNGVDHPAVLIWELEKDNCAVWEFVSLVRPSAMEFFELVANDSKELLDLVKLVNLVRGSCHYIFTGREIQNLVLVTNSGLAPRTVAFIAEILGFITDSVQQKLLLEVKVGEVVVLDLETKTILKKI